MLHKITTSGPIKGVFFPSFLSIFHFLIIVKSRVFIECIWAQVLTIYSHCQKKKFIDTVVKLNDKLFSDEMRETV